MRPHRLIESVSSWGSLPQNDCNDVRVFSREDERGILPFHGDGKLVNVLPAVPWDLVNVLPAVPWYLPLQRIPCRRVSRPNGHIGASRHVTTHDSKEMYAQ